MAEELLSKEDYLKSFEKLNEKYTNLLFEHDLLKEQFKELYDAAKRYVDADVNDAITNDNAYDLLNEVVVETAKILGE